MLQKESMSMNKKERQNFVRATVMAKFPEISDEAGEFTQIDAGAFVIPVTDPEGTESFVEVRFVVKGDTFDLFDAEAEFAEKVKKAKERAEAKALKDAEKAAKEAEKAAKKAEKEAEEKAAE